MDQPLTKKQLIDTMRVERARWEMLLLRVGPGRMSVPVEGTGRPVLEIVSTLYERERWLLQRLASIQGPPSPVEGAHSPVPGTNQPSRLIEASRDAFNDILRLLIPISHEDLFEAGRFPWARGGSLANVVSACTISYYVEHDPPLRSWLARPVVQVV
jgi:hypothetical protein